MIAVLCFILILCAPLGALLWRLLLAIALIQQKRDEEDKNSEK